MKNVEKAFSDIRDKSKTIRQAAEYYKIPKSTLHDRFKLKSVFKHGRQSAISTEEEKMLAMGITKFCEWSFPMTRHDIRVVVKNYLDRKGQKITCFSNNLSRIDWFYNFLKRNNVLTERFAQNIKRCRANVTKETIKEYFENLNRTVENVPASNIINFDETNMTDDPGKVKVLCKRGSKKVERIIDSSKSSTSVMMSVSASGVLLPPYVVYKSVHLYPTWVEGGPEGAVYNRTRSGWLDGPTFENWFDQIVIPYIKNLRGKKVLIGDNLASHVSIHVLECCAKYDVDFVLLPPNATHILQPLDAAVFAPFKKSWRAILTEWKVWNRGCILKSDFPRLFKKAIENVTNLENNIMAGFRTCGIFPVDPDVVLNKIPDSTEDPAVNQEHWIQTLQEFIHESRLATTQDTRKPRGKRLQVAPGKGINAQDLEQTEDESEEVFMSDSSGED